LCEPTTRDLAVAGGTVDGDVFAKRIVVADFHARHAALPFQILRLQPDARKRKYFVSPAERRVTVNDHMRMKFALVAEHDMFADDAIRTDFTAGANPRLGVDDGGR
jgi:hypothetical protein